ncbi:unnamed protein product [Adineta steineri]|uniref:Uncharacterized protein n=1 Tax=Adineta steineri TaxID=433720 RepID=A0A815DZ66_9BILA|nr:unnamed protein product [Adineta steineri]CAF1304642.1 unnamed protein product [Adineta steineri]CAF1577227.1 unnamed protein product [Adineta steineri]CAF1577308.1 unnamed protein product [Adineta steineri]
MKSQHRTVIASNITSIIFDQLYIDYADTLSCPCSQVTVPYGDFVNHTITFHSVCESIFVSEQWIHALYSENASRYGVQDFRTTAASQFRLMASLCSLSQDAIFQNQIDFDNDSFINSYLLREIEVQYRVNVTIQFFRSSASTQMMSFLEYITATNRANYVVSALNSNFLLIIGTYKNPPDLLSTEVPYNEHKKSINEYWDADSMGCSNTNPTTASGIFSLLQVERYYLHLEWYEPKPNSILINGFFAGCVPLDALLRSTLDCLYSTECLRLLVDKFPAITKMNINWTNSVLPLEQNDTSVNDHLHNLFIKEWSAKINHENYFNKCAPAFCTYIGDEQINFSYAATRFISLYGGLIIILRLIAPFLINVGFTLKSYSTNGNNYQVPSVMARVRKFGRFTKRLNLFKDANQRTEHTRRQQKITTHVYLASLTGSFLILIIYSSWSIEMITRTEPYPPLSTYNDLQIIYSETLKCPCSNNIIPYEKFVSLSAVLHQICLSDLVTNQWISLLKQVKTSLKSPDWRNIASSQFQLLADYCKLTNTTINDTVYRFLLQPFVASNILTESEFNKQLNATLEHFFRSTIDYFDIFLKTEQILTKVDQPFFGPITSDEPLVENHNPVLIQTQNGTTNVSIL